MGLIPTILLLFLQLFSTDSSYWLICERKII
jgi:hypothetical protein